jgi:hypothetical protein
MNISSTNHLLSLEEKLEPVSKLQSHNTVVGITKESNGSEVRIFVKNQLIIALTLIRRSI